MGLNIRIAAYLHALDLWLSSLFLTLGWMQEANPIAAIIYGYAGVAGLVALKVGALTPAFLIAGRLVPVDARLADVVGLVMLASGMVATTMLLGVMGIWLMVPAA
jgi:hypothetical protein